MITLALGISARKRSMLERTARPSTRRSPSFSINQIWLSAEIRTRMLGSASSGGGLLFGSGTLGLIPTSFTKEAVTIKKINIMNTTSSIGVRSISLLSSPARFFFLRLTGYSSWCYLERYIRYRIKTPILAVLSPQKPTLYGSETQEFTPNIQLGNDSLGSLPRKIIFNPLTSNKVSKIRRLEHFYIWQNQAFLPCAPSTSRPKLHNPNRHMGQDLPGSTRAINLFSTE